MPVCDPRPTSTARLALLLAGLALLAAAPLSAKPANFGTDGDGDPIHARWPDSTTIHVYIPTPPNPPGACAIADIHAGIQKWAAALAQRGIQVQFHDNQSPPAGAVNAVPVRWESPGTLGGDTQGFGYAHADDTPKGAAISSGYIQCETDEACGEGMRNLFAHEFGHVLGFDDEDTAEGAPHNVMDPDVPETPMDFSPFDLAELKSLYGCLSAAPPHFPKGTMSQSVTPMGGDPPSWLYEYVLEWFEGPEIPVFDLPLGCLPNQVGVVVLPPTWQRAMPPFYRDCAFDPPATATTRELHFHANGQALNALLPVGTFAVLASTPPVLMRAAPLVDVDDDGWFDTFPVLVPGPGPAGVPTGGATGGAIRWRAPSPNPFQGGTRLRFVAAAAWREGAVRVFDVGGRLVRVLELGAGSPGEVEVEWDGRSDDGAPVGPGAYYVRVTLDGAHAMGSVLRMR